MNHYTDTTGYNAIRSQPDWTFKASQPKAAHNPAGAYFTTYEPDEPNLSERIFVPRAKLAYIFSFIDVGDLEAIPGGRGRLGRIFYARADYSVPRARQLHHGATGL